jgi:hypothetical protein
MRAYDDPAFLTAEERLRAIAGILDGVILRLHRRAAYPAEPAAPADLQNPSESGADSLAVSEPAVLSVHNGYGF